MAKPRFHWFNPLGFDNRDLYTPPGQGRPVTPQYRVDAARAAERLGYEALLCMVGSYCADPWLAATYLLPQTEKINTIVAVRPGYTHPAVIAHQTASFQDLSNGRLWLNIVSTSHENELRAYGDMLDKPARYRRSHEFMQILNQCWQGETFDFHGEFYQVEGAGLPRRLCVRPRIFSGGSSDDGIELAARWSDVHLSYGETPPQIRDTVEKAGERAARHGRKLEFGIKINVIARRTSEEAWAEAERQLANVPDDVIARQQQIIGTRGSTGQARVQALNPGHKHDLAALRPYPNIWSGSGLTGGGGGSTTLVGSFEEVAERIEEYVSIGVEHMLLSGHPLLEGAYEVAEGLFPLFRGRADISEEAPALKAASTI
ncbi:MAG: LLM class flavin-dependent oxidoreductase [Sphingobium sp.]